MKTYAVVFSIALALGGMARAQVASDVARCQGCHASERPDAAPRLNGQHADYILDRLRAFHDPASQSPHATYSMWDVATSLGASDARAAALYFDSLPATPLRPVGEAAKLGRRVYAEYGCQACHGDNGEGHGNVPRLAGQRTLYLSQQMAALSLGVRYHPVMLDKARSLTKVDMDAMAAWLGSEKGP